MIRKTITLICMATLSIGAIAQDTVLNRNITVEREFQPIVQSTGKINQRPMVIESLFQPVEFTYSDYTNPLSPAFNVTSLLSQPTRFSQPKVLHGLLRGALGHVRTDFDFGYRVDDGKKSILDITAHHNAYWGRKTLENSTLTFDFQHQFSTCEIYFGLQGANRFYTRYGRYFDCDSLSIGKYGDFEARDKQNIWMVDAKVGIRSNRKSEVQYLAEIDYGVFDLAKFAAEHKIKLLGNVEYVTNGHHIGGNLSYAAFMYGIDSTLLADSLYNSRHNIRIEPYYEYVGKRVLLHAGVNLDVNIGKGQLLSNNENISFAPSPNVRFEAQLAPKWATLFVNATGKYGTGSLQGYMDQCRYLELLPGITSKHVSSYIPVDAELGFRFRAQKNLLIEVHGGYALMKNQCSLVAITDTTFQHLGQDVIQGDYNYFYSDYSRWKIGAAFSYHYQDIVNIHLWGDYYIWSIQDIDHRNHLAWVPLTEGRVYDRPDWELGLRVDARIDKHWSLFTDNHFGGSRWAITTKGDQQLKPTVDLNIGCQYEFNNSLALYLTLNNLMCRYNDIYYGYQTPGINGVAGVTWRF
ncbi:MAG: hypothetical protein MJZ92_05315 [Paludibacteraceae bacterium]|nr:hypothetical protein [Paludibacteraceae bacterium]